MFAQVSRVRIPSPQSLRTFASMSSWATSPSSSNGVSMPVTTWRRPSESRRLDRIRTMVGVLGRAQQPTYRSFGSHASDSPGGGAPASPRCGRTDPRVRRPPVRSPPTGERLPRKEGFSRPKTPRTRSHRFERDPTCPIVERSGLRFSRGRVGPTGHRTRRSGRSRDSQVTNRPPLRPYDCKLDRPSAPCSPPIVTYSDREGQPGRRAVISNHAGFSIRRLDYESYQVP